MSWGKTKVGEREFISIGKRNTFDAQLHSVSMPGLYITYIQILKYKQYLGFLERRGQDVRREEKVHNVTNNNDSIEWNKDSLCW